MAYKQRSAQDVIEGGTGVSSNTVYAVLCGGTTTTNPIQSIASVGTSGQVLTSNGAGALPTFQAAGGGISGPGSSTDNALARWNGTGGTAVQNSTVIVTDNGEMTNASQPAFLSYLATTSGAVTGNGTAVIMGDTDVMASLTAVFDQNSDFTDGSSTGAYLDAPVAGKYLLICGFGYSAVTSSHTSAVITMITSNNSYITMTWDAANLRNNSDAEILNNYIFTDMDIADLATVRTTVSSGTKVVILTQPQSGDIKCFFSGYLVC